MLHKQFAWYLAGPSLGVCVIACRALFNARLGVTGGYSEVIGKVMGRSLNFDWRGWFLIGVILGGTLFAVVAGGPDFHGYGYLTDHLHGGSRAWIAPILVLFGALVGYGAKLSGGCTSGNGLSGMSILSPASAAATCTFFGTAIAVSFLTKAIV
jgi:uncharacterized membrane protein YedE/YeeE